MKISATEAGQAETALVFFEKDGPGRWLLLDSAGVIVRGDVGEPLPAAAGAVLAIAGEQVAIHWLHLAEDLAPAQVAAAARLLLADSTTEPMADLHVAVGRPEEGRTPVAIVKSREMVDWLASAAELGLDPVAIVPTTMLLAPPAEGFLSRDREEIRDYRGPASAFSLEPSLAGHLIGAATVEPLSVEEFEARLRELLRDPPLNLRQGAFAQRRAWRLEQGPGRRMAALAIAFLLLTLLVQVTMILRYTFAADALETEARELATPGSTGKANFTTSAGLLFGAVQATPNVELRSLDYRVDGSLTAAVQADSPATLAAMVQRVEAAGLQAELGPTRTAGGRQAADLTVRP